MSLEIFKNPEKLSKSAASFFTDVATAAVKDHGTFSVALSGGGSPQRMYEWLASEPFRDRVPWEQTYVFWGDERFVPPNDPENNARMTREKLLDHVPLSSDHIFPIPTSGKPEAAAGQYASTLASFFDDNDEWPRFDFILLGLGENGHTASLFPETNVLNEKEKWVGTVYIKEKEQDRITLTAPVINRAKNILFLVYGKNKAQVLAKILQGPRQPQKLPSQLIKAENGTLSWYVDEEAGSRLKAKN